MKKRVGDLSRHHVYTYPRIPAILTISDKKLGVNIMPVAWHTSLSFTPPLYGVAIGRKRYSYKIVRRSREFVVNFMEFKYASQVHKCGRTSGRDVNKFNLSTLTPVPALKVSPPLINEAYAQFECKVVEEKVWGDHAFFVGEILTIHIDEDLFEEGIMSKKAMPLFYLGSDTYTTTDRERLKL